MRPPLRFLAPPRQTALQIYNNILHSYVCIKLLCGGFDRKSYIDERGLFLIVVLYAIMIWMVHISSACQYIHTFSTCTLHTQSIFSRIDEKTLWLQLIFIIWVGTWQGQLQLTRLQTYTFFSAYFTVICYATHVQIPCFHKCLVVFLWQDAPHPKKQKKYKTGHKTAMGGWFQPVCKRIDTSVQ